MIAVSEKMTASSVKAILLMTFSIKVFFLARWRQPRPTMLMPDDAGV
jgi:hypothetical protein